MERHTRSFLQLTKPGITLSNTLTGLAGFFLAVSGSGVFSWTTMIGVIGGIAGVIAAACVINNVIDRDIDARMKRTARRVLLGGSVSVRQAVGFAVLLACGGFGLLGLFTNSLTVALGVIACIWYIVIYGYAKRTTAFSTIVGGVPGALPPMAGYVAVTGAIDATAIILFLILFFWQLPHFYAISIFRRDDYEKAGLPVWAVRYGIKSAQWHIFASVLLYALVVPLLTIVGSTGIVYLVLSSVLSLFWVYKGVTLFHKMDVVKWSRTMFGISLVVLLAMIGLISIGGFLP